ncbi:MAG TPA: TIM barrel protein [Gemmataceae bacterium]|jgi:sugar phosphate isomerase/epimerase|nr:TIM barrel protein [Gemmataceae bacterium]
MTATRRQFLVAGAAGATALGMPTLHADEPKADTKTPHFKLGMVTYNVAAQWDLPTILKVCKNVGIAAVECRTTHKHGVEPTLTPEQRDTVKKQFADSGIVCWGCGTVCEFHAPDEAVVKKNIETCKQFVQLVHDIGGHMVKVRPNGLPKGVPVEKTLEQIGKALIECGKAGEAFGIEICVEVHGAGTQEPKNIKTIMDHCGHKSVGLTWNSNATDVKDGSVKEAFDLLKPWIKSCHINEIYKDSLGIYPYRELFRLFRESGYDRFTMIEVGRTPVDVASGEDMLRYYKALWTELAKG